jgi:flagellar hook-associated protein 2
MALQLNVGSLTSGTGIDVQSTVDQLMSLQKAPLTQMQHQQMNLQSETTALTDIQTRLRTLETAVQELGNYTGSLASRSVTSSQSSAISATATSSAAISQHQISVDHLANASSWYSNPSGSGSTFSAGSLVLQVGSNQPVTINVNQGDSLQTIANTVNAKNAGVTANVITDAKGSRLTLIGNSMGTANEISISGDTVGLGFRESTSAKNASLTVDGVQIDSASNTLTTVIPGVTLSLTSSTNGTATLNVQADTSQSEQALNTFVNAYNSAIQAISAQFTYDPTSKSSGPLSGDSSLRTIQETLLGSLSYSMSNNNGISTLVSLGINMQDDGTLSVDSGTLESALAGNYGAVQNFFQSTSPKGFSATLNSSLSAMLDSTNGAVTVDLKGISDTNTTLQKQMDDLSTRLDTEEQSMLIQFEQVDALLRSYPTTMDQITAVLGSLPSASIHSSSK